MDIHAHAHEVHEGLRGWTVRGDGSVAAFSLDAPCSVRDDRRTERGRLFFDDLLPDLLGVPLPEGATRRVRFPTGEVVWGRRCTWLSASGWTAPLDLPDAPVAALGWWALYRDGDGLRAERFAPPVAPRGASPNEDVLQGDTVWPGAGAAQLPVARVPFWVHTERLPDGLHFRHRAGTEAGVRTGPERVVVPAEPVVADELERGSGWTTWRVRGAADATCARLCDWALHRTLPLPGAQRPATRDEMLRGFLVCAFGLAGRTVPTRLALRYLVRTTVHLVRRADAAASVALPVVDLAWLAFVLLQDYRHADVDALLTPPPADGRFADTAARGARLWRVVDDYQRTWPLTARASAALSLALAAPRDPQQHSLFLRIQAPGGRYEYPWSPGLFRVSSERQSFRPVWEGGVLKNPVRDKAFAWADEALRHALLRTVAVSAALQLFRYPPWLRAMELQFVVGDPSRRALVQIPYQTGRYQLPEGELLNTVEQELFVFFFQAHDLVRALPSDAARSTSSLGVAMDVRRRMEGLTLRTGEYRRLIAPVTGRADLLFPSPALRDRGENRWWCAGGCRRDRLLALRDRQTAEGLVDAAAALAMTHAPKLVADALVLALGDGTGLFRAVRGESYRVKINPLWLLPLPRRVDERERPGTVLRDGWAWRE